MAQLININSTEFRRCNLSAIQTGGTWASLVPDENEIILISTANALTADGSGNCDAYIVGDGTTAATALPLLQINEGDKELKIFVAEQLKEKAEQGKTLIVNNYYLKASNGKFASATNWNCVYVPIYKGDILVVSSDFNATVAGYGLFKTLPTTSSTADIFSSTQGTIIAPFDGYLVCNYYSDISHCSVIKYVENGNAREDIDSMLSGMTKDIYSTEFFLGYVVPANGKINSDPYHQLTYIQVEVGDVLYSNGTITSSLGAGYSDTVPAIGTTLALKVPVGTTFPLTAERSGYFVVGAHKDDALYLYKKGVLNVSEEIARIDTEISETNQDVAEVNTLANSLSSEMVIYKNIMSPDVTYENKYMTQAGVWASANYQKLLIFAVSPNTVYYIAEPLQNHAVVAWYDHLPSENEAATNFVPYSEDASKYQKSPSDAAYMLISGYWNTSLNREPKAYNTIKTQTYLEETRDNGKARSLNRDKEILYIGDSISTFSYYWQGYLEEDYGLHYLRTLNGHPAAIGATTFMPNEEENNSPTWDSTLGCKSIWWRCCNQRLKNNGYNPGIISLFGGINDIAQGNKDYVTIGSVGDTPLVDDSSTFDETTVDFSGGWPTALQNGWPTGITLCQVIKGCYLMMKRDFPNAEIILPTILCSGGVYGTWKPTGETLTAGELLAIRQVQIANLYDIKCVPWYWSERNPTTCASGIFSSDTVHPNKVFAKIMAVWFAEYLPL